MNRIFIILTALIISKYCVASPQVPDYLIYKNDTIRTYNLLVEEYLQKKLKDKGQLFGLSFRNSIDNGLGGSLNCWRGYQAIYKLENDSLFVSDIIDCHSIENFDKETSTNYLEEIFGERVKNNKVFIYWFSGNISFPVNSQDNKVLRWDGVFENIFFKETVIKIEKGNLESVFDVSNYEDLENGINRFERDSISNVLFEQVKNYEWTKLNKFDCSDNYLITISPNGKVGEIRMAWTDEEIKEFFTKREYNHCIKSMKNALSNLQFDIIKRKGEPIEEIVRLEIWFEEDGIIENWTN